MHPAVKGCFLLMLWACDWAGDPYCGTCPWSQAWGNQEVVCRSVHYRAHLSRACIPTPPSPSLAVLPAVLHWYPGWEAPVPLRGPEIIYVLMTLRR